MVSLIIWLILQPDNGWLIGWYFIVGQVFCLLGDILLTFPRRFFLFGLSSFLVGHLVYIFCFQLWNVELTSWFILLVLAVFSFGFVYIGRIVPYLKINRGTRRLTALVVIYSIILSLMLLSAISTLIQPHWPHSSSVLISVGAILFFASDCLLAYDRFVESYRFARFLVRSTYYMAQILMSVGIAYFMTSSFSI